MTAETCLFTQITWVNTQYVWFDLYEYMIFYTAWIIRRFKILGDGEEKDIYKW